MRLPIVPRRWRQRGLAAVAATAAVASLLAGTRATAQPADGGLGSAAGNAPIVDGDGTAPAGADELRPVSTGGELAGIAPELAEVEVHGPGVRLATEAVIAVEDGLVEQAAAQAEAEARLAALAGERAAAEAAKAAHEAALLDAQGRGVVAQQDVVLHEGSLAAVQRFVDELVLTSYIGSGDDEVGLESPMVTPARRRATYSRALFEQKRAEHAALVVARDEAAGRLAQADADVAAAQAAIADDIALIAEVDAAVLVATSERDQALARQGELAVELGRLRAELAEARRTGEVTGAGMRLVVLDALWKAALVESERRPACALTWDLLAGISRVESRHGTFGGSSVDRDGDVLPRILGPALDGVAFALITDTDAGVYDGDVVFDRAVGPLQFIPSSWALFGEDADGDGFDDPNNVYDAALAAAEHLCRGGWDVSTPEGRAGALFSYNQSEPYRVSVESWQRVYAELLPGL
jgi:membrane-bound lytic murein transglycosylase B